MLLLIKDLCLSNLFLSLKGCLFVEVHLEQVGCFFMQQLSYCHMDRMDHMDRSDHIHQGSFTQTSDGAETAVDICCICDDI